MGSIITVSAWINDGSIGVAKVVTPATSQDLTLDIVLVKPASVPELDLLSSLLAGGAGIGAIAYARQRTVRAREG